MRLVPAAVCYNCGMALPKLTEQQYFELQDQFDRTPGLNDGTLASGEHYFLVALLNRFGYHPHSRGEALDITQELLANGYDYDRS